MPDHTPDHTPGRREDPMIPGTLDGGVRCSCRAVACWHDESSARSAYGGMIPLRMDASTCSIHGPQARRDELLAACRALLPLAELAWTMLHADAEPGATAALQAARAAIARAEGREAELEGAVRAQRDELLAACKLARRRLDQLGLDWLGKGPDPLEAAIARAEGREEPTIDQLRAFRDSIPTSETLPETDWD